MIGVARVTTMGQDKHLVAWVPGQPNPKQVLNPEQCKAGEDRIVMYAPDVHWCQVLRSDKLVYCEERMVYILMRDGEPIATRFSRCEMEDLQAHHINQEPAVRFNVTGIPL